jgi:hypothetical protein
MDDDALLAAFLARAIDNRTFRHADHVRVAFALLARHEFAEAAATFCEALKDIAARAGKPEAFHTTITIAFLAVIAERRAAADYPDFAAFAHANPDLMTKAVLQAWYAPARLASDMARKTFILPEAAQ